MVSALYTITTVIVCNLSNKFIVTERFFLETRKLFVDYSLHHPNRNEHMEEFMNWLHANGVNSSAVIVEKYGDDDYGLKANRDIEVGRCGHTSRMPFLKQEGQTI